MKLKNIKDTVFVVFLYVGVAAIAITLCAVMATLISGFLYALGGL